MRVPGLFLPPHLRSGATRAPLETLRMRLPPVYSSNQQGGLGDSGTASCLVLMASQAELLRTGFLLNSSLHFLGQGPAQGIIILEEEGKNPVWGKEETRWEGKQIPLLRNRGCRASDGGGSPPALGSCLGSRFAAHYLHGHSCNPTPGLVPARKSGKAPSLL